MAEPTNTPMPGATPRSGSPGPAGKLTVLHIGDPIKYNPQTYATFSSLFNIIRPSTEERQRPEFIKALKEKRWGDFHAIFRPFWGTGGEMGKWDAELIELLPDSVRVFASAGAGFDWADTKLFGEKGVIYCNAGLAAADAVADFAVAMIISTFRHLPWCMGSAITGSPAEFQDCHKRATAESRNLTGQVLGFVGLGNIGQAIAKRLGLGFGMKIHYFDVIRKSPDIEGYLSATFHDTMDSLLAASDCVVLCTPAGEGALMTAKTISKTKQGARFVNIARGSLVDDDAVADALESGRLSAVALDVHSTEPDINPRLLRLSKTSAMLTCHNAGGTLDTHIGFEELSMKNIMGVLTGGKAITPVNMHFLKSKM
ncbi:hypothetical protein MKZ38_010142 [Zalerion maritima]|uniref:D-mandelate dehydrogenase n=1 Tax=Zalerion maritima TaxID=339359 RepID=A0AAD5RFK7_9PEZI|nr:hypothetical protein MKZ38_010142 [Zalerion maritima]